MLWNIFAVIGIITVTTGSIVFGFIASAIFLSYASPPTPNVLQRKIKPVVNSSNPSWNNRIKQYYQQDQE